MNKSSTALILVGYQNDYFAPDGILRGVIENQQSVDGTLENTMNLISCLASTDLAIISTPIVLQADYRALAASVGILGQIKESGAFTAGSKGAETIDQLAAFGDRIEYVSGKAGFNAFSGTELEKSLLEKGVKRVLVAGMVTSLCIDSTGRAAYERGFDVTVLSDCTSARTSVEQEFFCEHVFPLYARVADSHTITKEFETGPQS
jgi:nicotinamidase-related amidase